MSKQPVGYINYTIQRGDSLSLLVKKFNNTVIRITVDELCKLNNIKNKNLIITGRKLKIPVYKPDAVGDDRLHLAMVNCMDAIAHLPEYQALMELMEE